MLKNKPFGTKPLITFKIANERKLNVEDLNFIYENTDSYELDDELLKRVIEYRKNRNLSINQNYKIDVKKSTILID